MLLVLQVRKVVALLALDRDLNLLQRLRGRKRTRAPARAERREGYTARAALERDRGLTWLDLHMRRARVLSNEAKVRHRAWETQMTEARLTRAAKSELL